METKLIVAFLFLPFCICLFLAWYFTHQARHRERQLMIEKGMNPDTHSGSGLTLFKSGIVVIGLSIGMGIIGVWTQYYGIPDTIALSILGVSGGSAMIVANRLSKPNC